MHASASLVLCLASTIALQACELPDPPPEQAPVLEFPEAGVDDPAAYEGYKTRFFRDTEGNTVQVYLNDNAGRVVHVWADAANESAAFSVKDPNGDPVPVEWASAGATTGLENGTRLLSYSITMEGPVEIGWFLLGTMRQERDFQYFQWHRRPYGDEPFVLRELTDLIDAMERLPEEERAAHLARLDADDTDELRSRLEPTVDLTGGVGLWTATVEHTSLDGRNRIVLVLGQLGGDATATLRDDRLVVTPDDGGTLELLVGVGTDSPPLTSLGRDRLFNEAFETYYAEQERRADSLRAQLGADAGGDARLTAFRRLERQVLGLELLSSGEKLMASLPNYATYFGRDQMMSALMLEPISSVDLQELVIGSVLGKVDREGNVSHEEALGGQAIREAAAEYARTVAEWEALEGDFQAARERLLRARALLEDVQSVRENYRMVDDDFQILLLVDRYLARADVPDERKRDFLTAALPDGRSRFEALAWTMAFAAELARPYADDPATENLVEFFHRDDRGWLPGSWRDSRVGYGSGRYAMDVNVVWVPEGLAAIERTARAAEALGLSARDAAATAPFEHPALDGWLADPASLAAAVQTWRGARRHYVVELDPAEMRSDIEAALGTFPDDVAAYWRDALAGMDAADRPLTFLALALDDDGEPIAAPNTDPATDLFLGDYTDRILAGEIPPDEALELVDAIGRPYPVGTFVEGLGPLIVNDAYASGAVQRDFRDDLYHSPSVVWGREVNLLLLGLAKQVAAAYDEGGTLRSDDPAFVAYIDTLRDLLDRTQAAVETSGLGHNELWSYRIEDGVLRPVRYGQSSDIQLWNVTDLAVGFLLERLPPR